MADSKISALTATASLDGTELAPVVQSGVTKRTTVSQIIAAVKAALTKTDVGLANVANVDTTNASNISSGTLAAARGGAGAVNGILKADGAGNVSAASSGTDFKTVNSTSILGSGNISISASPGGSSGSIQYNNSGAFGGVGSYDGSSTIRFGTNAFQVNIGDPTSGVSAKQFVQFAGDNGSYTPYVGYYTSSEYLYSLRIGFRHYLTGVLNGGGIDLNYYVGRIVVQGWSLGFSAGPNAASDLTLRRVDANTLSIGDVSSGTAYRDVKLRGVQFGSTYTVSTLPTASTVDGMTYRVSDLSAPTLGAAPSGGGSTKGLVTSNGSSYTVTQFG
jgi:hypothetical protein